MLDQYPKTRPALPEEIAKIYNSQYKENREGGSTASSLAQRMESWLHRRVAADALQADDEKATLELGAGTLNQLQYESAKGPYDIVEPFSELYQGSPLLQRIRNVYADTSEVDLVPQYDRITSVATLEHICNLPEVVARSGLMLNPQGVFRAAIPSEGTILWALGWRLTTGLEFRLRYGLDYGLLMKHEHVNKATEIENVVRQFFRNVRVSVFGLVKQLSLYQYLECRDPDLTACQAYLAQVGVATEAPQDGTQAEPTQR